MYDYVSKMNMSGLRLAIKCRNSGQDTESTVCWVIKIANRFADPA